MAVADGRSVTSSRQRKMGKEKIKGLYKDYKVTPLKKGKWR